MLIVPGGSYRNCDGISRRNFLQVGAPLLGLGLGPGHHDNHARPRQALGHLAPRRICHTQKQHSWHLISVR